MTTPAIRLDKIVVTETEIRLRTEIQNPSVSKAKKILAIGT